MILRGSSIVINTYLDRNSSLIGDLFRSIYVDRNRSLKNVLINKILEALSDQILSRTIWNIYTKPTCTWKYFLASQTVTYPGDKYLEARISSAFEISCQSSLDDLGASSATRASPSMDRWCLLGIRTRLTWISQTGNPGSNTLRRLHWTVTFHGILLTG